VRHIAEPNAKATPAQAMSCGLARIISVSPAKATKRCKRAAPADAFESEQDAQQPRHQRIDEVAENTDRHSDARECGEQPEHHAGENDTETDADPSRRGVCGLGCVPSLNQVASKTMPTTPRKKDNVRTSQPDVSAILLSTLLVANIVAVTKPGRRSASRVAGAAVMDGAFKGYPAVGINGGGTLDVRFGRGHPKPVDRRMRRPRRTARQRCDKCAAQRLVAEREAARQRLVGQHLLAAEEKLVGEIAEEPQRKGRDRNEGRAPERAAELAGEVRVAHRLWRGGVDGANRASVSRSHGRSGE